ncbi:MAG: undecaprenyl-diphosphatase UppP [Anaerolineaceae bacterium]|nr:undecaprenyl-diphosphatase UppP [Anaerolineaceae bacterium]
MTIIQAIILGIVQGLTEFLPISSSAHLVLVPFWFNWKLSADQAFVFNVLVQMGTLVAVIIYFSKDLLKIFQAFFKGLAIKKPFENSESRLGWFIILATIPGGLAGLLLKDQVEEIFSNPFVVIGFLILTALLLALAERFGNKVRTVEKMTPLDAIIIGVFQAAAIFPGISRSGTTISGSLFRKFTREAAARFSFILSIPIMLAAGLIGVIDLFQLPSLTEFLPIMIIGFVVSGIIGYLAIAWLMKFLANRPLYTFSIYCVFAATLTLVIHYVR